MLRLYDRDGKEITHDLNCYCKNPACLGEPWCSAWGICRAAPGLEQESTMEEAELELEYDNLFLELSQHLDPLPHDSPTPLLVQSNSSSTHHSTTSFVPHTAVSSSLPNKKKRQFASVKTDTEVQTARATGTPKKTMEDTKYCLGLWDEWVRHREKDNGDSILPITELSRGDLQYWLTRFILEVNSKA